VVDVIVLEARFICAKFVRVDFPQVEARVTGQLVANVVRFNA